MKSCEFDVAELDLLNHAVMLLRNDLRNALRTYSLNYDLQSVQETLDGLSTIEFILPKIKI